MKPARLFQLFAAGLTTCVALAQQAANPAEAPASPPDEEDVPEAEEEWDFSKGRSLDPVMLERLNLMLPPGGKPHEGLSYPLHGKRTSQDAPVLKALFESKRVTRLDETHVLFEGAVYSSYGDPKKPDTPTQTITFKDAIYDLQHHLVSSASPIAVDDKEVNIHCGGVIHDLTTGFTIYSGGVELYLNDEDATQAVPVSSPDAKPANPAPQTPVPPLAPK